MSNQIGNFLYKLTIKKIQSLCTSEATRILSDFVLDKAPMTHIYNITDIVFEMVSAPSNAREITTYIKERTGIEVAPDDETRSSFILKSDWSLFTDNVFLYAKTLNNLYYACLIHRISDDRVVVFFGTVEDDYFTMFESAPVEISFMGVKLDISHLKEASRAYANQYNIKQVKEYDRYIEIISVTFFAQILRLFRDITDQNSRKYRCYIDEFEGAKPSYFRHMVDKATVKVPDKPIYLILRDTEDSDTRAKSFGRKNGNLHYSFSWVVRGHYRKLHNPDSIGLNREGERCVPGMTWVETYMKGDENAPLLKRTTVVIDKRKNA